MVRKAACEHRFGGEHRSRARRQALRCAYASAEARTARDPKSSNARGEFFRRNPASPRGAGEMSLFAGTRLGPYEIVCADGRGRCGRGVTLAIRAVDYVGPNYQMMLKLGQR